MLWAQIAERCAEVFGATRRARLWIALGPLIAATLLALVLATRWGARGLLPIAAVAALAFFAAAEVMAARDRVWAAARLPLGDPKQRPSDRADERLMAPTALALRRLALAVDAARRGRYGEANDWYPTVPRERHPPAARAPREARRPAERALLEAVRAMVSLGLGDDRRAARQAILALPTGSDEMDRSLGRAVIADAWRDPDRLGAIDRAWGEAGVDADGTGTLPVLRRLVRVKVDAEALDAVAPADARALSDEARAIGDDDLAGELDYRARRSQTYR